MNQQPPCSLCGEPVTDGAWARLAAGGYGHAGCGSAASRVALADDVLLPVLRKNFYRISRYPDVTVAEAALRNVAMELARAATSRATGGDHLAADACSHEPAAREEG